MALVQVWLFQNTSRKDGLHIWEAVGDGHPKILRESGNIGLFVAADANINTLQKYKFATVWDQLSIGGAVIINNIGNRLCKILQAIDMAQVHTLWQMENPSCVTWLILKK